MTKVQDLSESEKRLIESEIDSQFKKIILEPRRTKIENFLEAVIVNQNGIKTTKDIKISIFDLVYYANCPLSGFRICPNPDVVADQFVEQDARIELPTYSYSQVNDIAEGIIKQHQLDYAYMMDGVYFDPAYLWESQSDLELEFFKSCWASLKPKNKLKHKCFLIANDGSGDYIDLDNGSSIPCHDNSAIPKYLDSLGIKPNFHLVQKKKWWQF